MCDGKQSDGKDYRYDREYKCGGCRYGGSRRGPLSAGV